MGTELAIAGLVLSGVSAVGSVMQGYAAAAGYNRQANALEAMAKMDIVRGDAEALKYKAQGVQILREMNKAMGASNAKSGAGGLVLNTGTPGQLQIQNQANGVNDFLFSVDNENMSHLIGQANASQHRSQAAAARSAAGSAISGGWFSAIGSVAKAGFSAGQLGLFGGGGGLNFWDLSSAKVYSPGAETSNFFGGSYIPKI